MLKSDRTEEVAAATSSTPLERVAETPTDDCIAVSRRNGSAPAVRVRRRDLDRRLHLRSSRSGTARAVRGRRQDPDKQFIEASPETALEAAALEPIGEVTAEKLMTIWSRLRSKTQWYGRQAVADGSKHPNEHHQITEALVAFRAAACKASLTERQRFLEMTALQVA